MLRKIADFLVDKRIAITTVFVIATLVSLWLMTKVNVNYDLAEYLPADSSMRIGLDIMEEEFPDSDTSTVRVMFEGLEEEEKPELADELAALDAVENVAYEVDSADYNKDAYTLYELTTSFDANSKDAQAFQSTVTETYEDGGYTVFVSVAEANANVPAWIFILAIAILMLILFLMCKSWTEPFLFLLTIGMAIALNMGTNAFLGSVSSVTHMIVAVLQLVLSMDYSIILINRYRQELPIAADKHIAMKNALRKAIPAIASSSLTTIVGLLALVFMSFKIGADLGIVLAKGVLASLICVLTVLPTFILACNSLIKRTEKRTLSPKMDKMGMFSHRFRYVILGAFVVLFAAVFLFRGNTPISYVLTDKNQVEEVFPAGSTTVLLYDNADEATIAGLVGRFEALDAVKSVNAYANTIGKPYTVEGLTDALADSKMTDSLAGAARADGDADTAALALDSSMLRMIYYDYYRGGQVEPMTLHEFARFVLDEVAPNPTFAGQIDTASLGGLEYLALLTDPGEITAPRSSAQMASFLGMDQSSVAQLFFYYYSQYGGDPGTLSLPTFLGFLLDDVAANPQYAASFDQATLSQLSAMRSLLGAATSGQAFGATQLAAFTGVDAAMVNQVLFAAGATEMTIPAFLDFLIGNFSAYLDPASLAQLTGLKQMVDASVAGYGFTSSDMASLLGLDAGIARTLYYYYVSLYGDTSSWCMSLQCFIDFILNDGGVASYLDSANLGQLQALQGITNDALAGRCYTPAELVSALGSMSASSLSENEVSLLYLYRSSLYHSDPAWTLSLYDLFGFLTGSVLDDARFSPYIDEATRTTIYDAKTLIDDAFHQLVGSGHSRLVITTSLSSESDEVVALLDEVAAACDTAGLSGDYHLIGNAAMAKEMSQSFASEQNLIMLLTALAIFIVVALTFRSLIIPLILVLLIQCGVFATVVIIGLQGYSIYYLALLIVQSILMGATIDYAILYTTYYREKRRSMEVGEALGAAYNGSINTILTSGSIMVLVTWLISYAFTDPAISQICLTISKGACCALVLIIFILPGLLATFDRLVCRKTRADKGE